MFFFLSDEQFSWCSHIRQYYLHGIGHLIYAFTLAWINTFFGVSLWIELDDRDIEIVWVLGILPAVRQKKVLFDSFIRGNPANLETLWVSNSSGNESLLQATI